MTRPVSGGGLGSYITIQPPFAVNFWITTGQSLDVGDGQFQVSLTQPFNNQKLLDIKHVYNTSLPNDPYLQIYPLIAPMKPTEGGIAYPGNIFGETPGIAFANALTALFLRARYSSYNNWLSTCGQGASAYSVIKKGGTGNSFVASTYECTALKRLAGSQTFGCLGVLLTHGESDADNFSATYQSDITTFQNDYLTSVQAITGQSAAIPMYISQQNSNANSGFGPNTTATAQLLACQANPTKLIWVGPKYQYAYIGDRQHLAEYRPLGEKFAQVAYQVLTGTYSPFWPVLGSIVRVGTTVTIPLSGGILPYVFDGTHTGPHLSGGLVSWGPGKGLEAYDATQTISAATNANPIVLTVASAANYSNGQTVYVSGVLGNTNANGAHTITVSGNQITLVGTTGNGAFSAGAGGATIVNVIGITSAGFVGSSVVMTLARPPTTGLFIGNADTADVAYGTLTGGFPDGRCSLIRDSDPYIGPTFGAYTATGFLNYNWLPEFKVAVA